MEQLEEQQQQAEERAQTEIEQAAAGVQLRADIQALKVSIAGKTADIERGQNQQRQEEVSRAAARPQEGAAASSSAGTVIRAAGGSCSHAQHDRSASLGMLMVGLAWLMDTKPHGG